MKSSLLAILESYLVFLAKILLAEYRPVIIAITGSVGKTTTKEALYHVLKKNHLAVARTESNLNTPLGVSLAILGYNHSPAVWEWPMAFIVLHINWLFGLIGLRPLARYWIIELGVDRLGDMKRLLGVVKPTIGILTWIGAGHHLESLVDPATIAKEKGQLLAALPNDGLAIIPQEEPQIEGLASLAQGKIVRFTGQGPAGLANILSAVGQFLALPPEKVQRDLTSFAPPPGRLSQLAGINHTLLIDDSYNSSLPSVELALATLQSTEGQRKVAILGDILEQGQAETAVHTKTAELAKASADLFIGVGKRMKAVNPDHWFASPDEAANAIPELIRPGDVILVKGSQGMRLEKISQALAADPHEAAHKLARQSRRWRQIPFTNP